MVKSRYIGDGHPTFKRNPYNWYINPYYWIDDHPLLYGNNGSLDPGTHVVVHMHLTRLMASLHCFFGVPQNFVENSLMMFFLGVDTILKSSLRSRQGARSSHGFCQKG